MFQIGFGLPNSSRESEVSAVLKLVRTAFGIEVWRNDDGDRIDLSAPSVKAAMLRSRPRKDFDELGCNVWLTGDVGNNRILAVVLTGGNEWSRNVISISFPFDVTPSFQVFRDCIEPCKPQTAHVLDDCCSELFNTTMPILENVSIAPYLCGVHFFGAAIVDLLGGMKKCLATPAHHVEQIADGVLIRLVDCTFTRHNPRHVEIQRRAMLHLGLVSVRQGGTIENQP